MEAQSEPAAPRNSAVRSSKLKYPLRSAGKVKEAPVPVPSAPKRVAKASADVSKSVSNLDPSKKDKPSSSSSSSNQGVVAKSSADVTKSVSILDLSKKDKPSPSTKRLSIPTKPNLTKPNGPNGLLVKTPNSSRPNIPKTDTTVSNSRPNIPKTETPVSNSRPKMPKSDSPMSNVSVSNIARRKFSMICSVSYWMTQIKLAETASKHNISLGFFKLAFESGCEPLDRMKEELKTYIITHNLSPETSPPLTEILNLYDITEDLETLKISVPKKSESPTKTLISKPNPKTAPVSASVAKRNRNLKPRSLNSEANVDNGGSRVRVSNVKNVVKEKKVKVKKEKREDNNGEKENENCDSLLVEESGSSDDITQKQEQSDKEQNEITEIVPSAELSSEEEKDNMVEVPFAEVSAVVLEA